MDACGVLFATVVKNGTGRSVCITLSAGLAAKKGTTIHET